MQPGDKVVLHSLSRAEFNGREATLKQYVTNKERWALILDGEGHKGILVAPDNLTLLKEIEAPAVEATVTSPVPAAATTAAPEPAPLPTKAEPKAQSPTCLMATSTAMGAADVKVETSMTEAPNPVIACLVEWMRFDACFGNAVKAA